MSKMFFYLFNIILNLIICVHVSFLSSGFSASPWEFQIPFRSKAWSQRENSNARWRAASSLPVVVVAVVWVSLSETAAANPILHLMSIQASHVVMDWKSPDDPVRAQAAWDISSHTCFSVGSLFVLGTGIYLSFFVDLVLREVLGIWF